MDSTYFEKVNDKPHLVILEYDVTFTTKNGKYKYLVGKKVNSNIVLVQKQTLDEDNQEIENINLDYAWYEIKQNIEDEDGSFEDSVTIKNAYIKYLMRHYNLGCNQHKHYKGYQKLIDFIKPLIFDFT